MQRPSTSAQAPQPFVQARSRDPARHLVYGLCGVGILTIVAIFSFAGFRAVTGEWPDYYWSMRASPGR